jgi:hypothetical protein
VIARNGGFAKQSLPPWVINRLVSLYKIPATGVYWVNSSIVDTSQQCEMGFQKGAQARVEPRWEMPFFCQVIEIQDV